MARFSSPMSIVRSRALAALGRAASPAVAVVSEPDGRWRVVTRSARNGRVLRVVKEEIVVHADAVSLAATVETSEAVTVAVEAQTGRRRNRQRETAQRRNRHERETRNRALGIGYVPGVRADTLTSLDGGGNRYPAGTRKAYSSEMEAWDRQPRVSAAPKLELDPLTIQRFNAFACAAMPNEIGGLLRVVGTPEGGYRVVDMKIFPHLTASGAYFELDGVEVAKFLSSILRASKALKAEGKVEEAEAKKAEIAEWRSLVHSHPRMSSFMSGTDKENLERLASGSHAFSVIVSAWDDPEKNYVTVHYAQSKPWPLTITNLLPETDRGATLAGIGALNEAELAEIKAEVEACGVHNSPPRWSTGKSLSKSPRPTRSSSGLDNDGYWGFREGGQKTHARGAGWSSDPNETTRSLAPTPLRHVSATALGEDERRLLKSEINIAASTMPHVRGDGLRVCLQEALTGLALSDHTRAWLRSSLIERAAARNSGDAHGQATAVALMALVRKIDRATGFTDAAAVARATSPSALRRTTLPFGEIERRIVAEALSYEAEQSEEDEQETIAAWQAELDKRTNLYGISFLSPLASALERYLPVLEAAENRRDKIVLEKLVEQIQTWQGPARSLSTAEAGVRVFADDAADDEVESGSLADDDVLPFMLAPAERELILEAIEVALEDADRAEHADLRNLGLDLENGTGILSGAQARLLYSHLTTFSDQLDDEGRLMERGLVVGLVDVLDLGVN